jgi:hypothetical protein
VSEWRMLWCDEGKEVSLEEGFEEGGEGEFGLFGVDMVCGRELVNEGFEGGVIVDVVPNPEAEGVEVEGLLGGGTWGEELAESIGFEGGSEPERFFGPDRFFDERIFNGNGAKEISARRRCAFGGEHCEMIADIPAATACLNFSPRFQSPRFPRYAQQPWGRRAVGRIQRVQV